MNPTPLPSLDDASLSAAIAHLCGRDADLAAIVTRFGPPPLWSRPAGFPTLVYIILEQQVSLASARAAFERLQAAVRPLTPRRFLRLTPRQLKRIGFSRQKTRYARELAHAILAGRFRPQILPALPDDAVRERMLPLKGIGDWTVDIYLLMVLLRPDAWPHKDLALAVAVQKVKRLRKRPTPEHLAKLSEQWRPFRAVAARLFWHHYLQTRRNGTST